MDLGSGIQKKLIPDSGSGPRGQKSTGSRNRIRNTVFFFLSFILSGLSAWIPCLSLSVYYSTLLQPFLAQTLLEGTWQRDRYFFKGYKKGYSKQS
jgi:hypothetical protein